MGVVRGIGAQVSGDDNETVDATAVTAPHRLPARPPARRASARELGTGDFVGGYRVESLLGTGGFGAVYLGIHPETGRKVAIKVLRAEFIDSPRMVARFLREAQAVNRIHHPNIVEIYETGQLEDSSPFLVMELVEGRNLRSVIKDVGPLTPGEALNVLVQVGDAVHAAHQMDIVHRDLKASNVMLVDGTNPPLVKLLDFGIAKLMDPGDSSGLTSAGCRVGTPHVMAPEQVSALAVDARTDVYGLGCLVFQILTGRYPFMNEDPIEVERMHLCSPAPAPSRLVPTLPASIDDVVLRCLEKEPDKRFSTAADVVAALRAAVDGTVGDTQKVPAIGVLVQAHTGGDQPGDEALLAAADMIEVAAARLRAAGFAIPVETGTLVLGVELIPGASALDTRRGTIALALAIHDQLTIASSTPSLDLAVIVHTGPADVRNGEIVGGPIVDVGAWSVPEGAGVSATASALEGVIEPRVRQLGE